MKRTHVGEVWGEKTDKIKLEYHPFQYPAFANALYQTVLEEIDVKPIKSSDLFLLSCHHISMIDQKLGCPQT